VSGLERFMSAVIFPPHIRTISGSSVSSFERYGTPPFRTVTANRGTDRNPLPSLDQGNKEHTRQDSNRSVGTTGLVSEYVG